MKLSRVEQAARNNAIWCDTVCRLHGAPGQFLENVWLNHHRTPAYYPNLVTLREAADPAAVFENTRDLIGRVLSGSCAVKDSFQTLDLSTLSFNALFQAAWIWHDELVQRPVAQTAGIRWGRVVSPDELAIWEAKWSKADQNTVMADRSRQFKSELLADPRVVIFAGYRGQQLIAGGIANSSDEVVGLSNVFTPPDDETLVWAGLLQNTHTAFPGIPVVGYEHGPSLKAALAVGFGEIGTLTVWLHHA
jgi:hypothetical protein